jgi:hypothetical protein
MQSPAEPMLDKSCRYLGQSLAATIVKSNQNDPLDFGMILGVGDDSTFQSAAPTWEQPASTEELCYVGVSLSLNLGESQEGRIFQNESF